MARINKEWRVEYMKTYFHDIDIRDEGREEGRVLQLVELVNDGIISLDIAVKKSKLSEEEFIKYLNGENNE